MRTPRRAAKIRQATRRFLPTSPANEKGPPKCPERSGPADTGANRTRCHRRRYARSASGYTSSYRSPTDRNGCRPTYCGSRDSYNGEPDPARSTRAAAATSRAKKRSGQKRIYRNRRTVALPATGRPRLPGLVISNNNCVLYSGCASSMGFRQEQ